MLRFALGPATDAGCGHLGRFDQRGVGYPGAGGQVPGVDRASGDANVEMHTRSMGAAGVADLADDLAGRDGSTRACGGGKGGHVGVVGDDPVGVLDVDDVAVCIVSPRVDHGAAGGGADGGALGRHHVQTGVAVSEPARYVFELRRRSAHCAAEGLRLGGERKKGEQGEQDRAHRRS